MFSDFRPEGISLIQNAIKSDYDVYRHDLELSLYWIAGAQKCESPIESLLFWELFKIDKSCLHKISTTKGIQIIGIEPQWSIELEDRKVRFDIFIRVWQHERENLECYVIECEGHDFHEKTKEQAARDKWRDRLISKHGFHLLKFTGSEIYRNSQKVAIEIFDRILSDFRKVSNG